MRGAQGPLGDFGDARSELRWARVDCSRRRPLSSGHGLGDHLHSGRSLGRSVPRPDSGPCLTTAALITRLPGCAAAARAPRTPSPLCSQLLFTARQDWFIRFKNSYGEIEIIGNKTLAPRSEVARRLSHVRFLKRVVEPLACRGAGECALLPGCFSALMERPIKPKSFLSDALQKFANPGPRHKYIELVFK